jgi:putative FmdB family regulatory protein
MPIYEYECRSCGKRTELLQRMGDPPLAACPDCGGEVKKLFSAPAVQFKGTGWYVTDYAKKGGRSDKSGKTEKAEGSGSAEAKSDAASESRPESKPESKKEAAPASSKETAK